MRNILIISALDVWSMGEGKGAPSLEKTLRSYADNGWKVFFLTGVKTKESVYNIHPNIEIIRFNSLWLNINPYFAKSIWWLYFEIAGLIIGLGIAKRQKIDLFYGYEIHGIPIAKMLSLIFGKKIISRFQGTKVMAHTKERFWMVKYWDHVIAMKIPTDLVIMTDDGTQGDKLLKKLGVDMDKVKFWMNGVKKETNMQNFNKEEFKKKLGIKEDNKIILAVSRLELWKRVDRILSVLPRIKSKYNNIKLLIVGEGGERKNLENLAKELGINNDIMFLGSLCQRELGEYYGVADIFVTMYDISNVGNPLLEAMIYGKCIVSLEGGDTYKFIRHNETGILIKSDQLNDSGDVIIELLKDDNKRLKLGNNAEKFARENFWTWEDRLMAEIKEAKKLIKFYE